MRRVVLDTNVLVSFLTDRDPDQQRRAAELLDAALAGELRLILPQIVATELVYVLGNLYDRPADEVAGTLTDLLATPGIEPVDELPWPILLDVWPEVLPSFADAAIAAIARRGRHDAIATFDRRLAAALEGLGLVSWWTEPEP